MNDKGLSHDLSEFADRIELQRRLRGAEGTIAVQRVLMNDAHAELDRLGVPRGSHGAEITLAGRVRGLGEQLAGRITALQEVEELRGRWIGAMVEVVAAACNHYGPRTPQGRRMRELLLEAELMGLEVPPHA